MKFCLSFVGQFCKCLVSSFYHQKWPHSVEHSVTLLGFALGNAAQKEEDVRHVADAPVSNSHEKVLPPALAVTLGLILSPLKGAI
jgi:hypothetical protein